MSASDPVVETLAREFYEVVMAATADQWLDWEHADQQTKAGYYDHAYEVREKLPTTADRRELWRLENFLAVNGTTETHRERHLRLYRYLNDTCEHDWADVGGWGGSAKGTQQCSWCSAVLAPGERLAPASTEPLPTENAHRVWQERYSARVISA